MPARRLPTARLRGASAVPAGTATIRIMGPSGAVENALSRLLPVGFVETGRAPMRDVADGVRVYGLLAAPAAAPRSALAE